VRVPTFKFTTPPADPVTTQHQQPRLVRTPDGGFVPLTRKATIASAVVIHANRLGRIASAADWQQEVWDLYEALPEIRYAVNWVGNACSRARLYVGRIDPDGSGAPVPVESNPDEDDPDAPAFDPELLLPLAELFGGQSGQGEGLRRMAVQVGMVGETYVIGYDDPDTGERVWQVASSDEIDVAGMERIKLQRRDHDSKVELNLADGTCQIIRLWVPHPRIAWLADSPLVSLRSTAQEVMDLSGHISASAKSRLAGAGLLFIPDSLTFPDSDSPDGGVNASQSDKFKAILMEAMSAPIRDRDHPSAMVPIVVSGPAAAAEAIKWMTFSTPLDDKASEMRDSAVRRLAVGLDLPSEILTGLGDSNHWSAWAIEESALKLHVEPLLGLIASALTVEFLRPALVAMGREDADEYALWYDVSELTARPNRAPEALQAHGADLISDGATRRELGFSDADAPTNDEAQRRFIEKIIIANPSLAVALLPLIGINPPGLALIGTDTASPGRTPRIPVTDNTPRQGPPELPPGQTPGTARTASLDSGGSGEYVACQMAVYRALDRAGQWLIHRGGRSLRGQFADVPLHEIHTHVQVATHLLDQMLTGAYKEFFLAMPGEECAHRAVDSYVRSLLVAGHQHNPVYLRAAMQQAGCLGQGVHDDVAC
jgi:hypothetical protein